MDDKNLTNKRTKAPKAVKSKKTAKLNRMDKDKELAKSLNLNMTKGPKLDQDKDCEEDKNDKELTGFGAYLGSLPKYPLLKEEEEAELVKLAQGKSKKAFSAREKLILSNLRLVISMAKRYTKYGCPMEDLVSEGSIGLGVAIEKYKATRGARLSTYAVWWIKQYLRKATNDSARTIRIPIYQQKTLRAINATVSAIRDNRGYEPSDDEVAGELGIPTKQVQNLRHATVPLVSLQNPISYQENSRTYEEVLYDQTGNSETPLESLSKKTASDGLISLIKKRLNKKEQNVIILRFGLDEECKENRTLEEVGNLLSLTRERIRQIQEMALKKLKRSLEAEASSETTLLTVFK